MKRAQPGFSLAELLVTAAIAAVLMGVIATVLFQMTTIGSSGNDQLTIWHELQNVTDQLETDGQAALTASGGSTLTLTFPGGGTVTYGLTGTNLVRTSSSALKTLAQNVASLNFGVTGRMVTVDITDSTSGRTANSEQISCLVNLRPSSP